MSQREDINPAEEEEDDYLSNAVIQAGEAAIDSSRPKESSLQKMARLKNEVYERSHPLSKDVLASISREKRELALGTPLDSSNKGAQMLAKMGYKGGGLGKIEGAITEPISLSTHQKRSGVGMDKERKRKREPSQDTPPRVSVSEYQDAKSLEWQEAQDRRKWRAAMIALEEVEFEELDPSEKLPEDAPILPLCSVNLLYRSLTRRRLEDLPRDRSGRRKFIPALYVNVVDGAEVLAYGKVGKTELDETDTELENHLASTYKERLSDIVVHLREKYNYCFWCRFRYDDAAMKGCPGATEEDHDDDDRD